MTDRLIGLVVGFKKPIREDDAEAVMNAIRLLRPVGAVTPMMDEPRDWINRESVRRELEEKLREALKEKR